MAKKIDGYINLQVPAGQANPSPPIGPALGQRGLNIMEFCKQFNAKSKDMEAGAPVPVENHGVFGSLLQLRDADAAVLYLIKKIAKIGSGSRGTSGRRRHGDDGAGARGRQAEDEGPQYGQPGRGGKYHRWNGKVHGHSGCGVTG